MSLFRKSNKSKRAKKQNSEVISQMREIIKKLETGQMSVKSYGAWAGVGDEYNFHLTLNSVEIPVLAEELQGK